MGINLKLNINYKGSIAKRLFIITAISFGIFILITLVAQTVFFEKFYINKKKSDMKNNLKKFKTSYVGLKDTQEIGNLIFQYEENYNYRVLILDEAGRQKYIISTTNERADMSRGKSLFDLSHQINERNLIQDVYRAGKAKAYFAGGFKPGTTNIIGGLYIHEKNEYLFISESLRPVNEASGVIKEFYTYFFVIAIILVIIMSLFYSNIITKPLLEINKSASKMAQLDFTERCVVRGEDEIGNLAGTLNFLSENLQLSLNSLKEANSKLQEDIDRERYIERMRKEFVASVSHELKTPINLIEGYAEGLKDNIFEDKDKEFYLDVIIDEAQKMGSLVYDMLDLSQLESGSFKLNKEEFSLKELIERTIKKLSGIINDKSINLELNLADNIMVYGDWNRIEQVMINYITNAVRHTDIGGKITINMIEDNKLARVEVLNSGENIPEDEMDKIWDKFYKVDKSRNRSFGGTGMGLSIVKNIVLLHGGSYGAENTEGGVKFYFSIEKR